MKRKKMTTLATVVPAFLLAFAAAGPDVSAFGVPVASQDALGAPATPVSSEPVSPEVGGEAPAAGQPCTVKQEIEITLTCTFEGTVTLGTGKVCAKGKLTCTGEGISGSFDIDRCFDFSQD